MRSIVLILAMLALGTAHAEPFPKGDAGKGKQLADKQCKACHVSLFGGDGSGVYTRADRKVKNAQQLASRVAACNTNTGANWMPEEEHHVAAYLNKTYYHFK